MAYTDILSTIDVEIARLQEARSLLTGIPDALPEASEQRRGGPKGSKNVPKPKAKHIMSDKARKAIGDAQRKRHADKKLLMTGE